MSDDDVKRQIEEAEAIDVSPPRLNTTTLTQLMGKDFEPIKWIVPSLLPEGLTVLVGSPKIGKSWLALSLCQSVAFGGFAINQERVVQGESLYLALEDNERRLQGRFETICREEVRVSDLLHFATSIGRADQGGLELLVSWLDEHPECRLVVIDTLQRFRACSYGGKESYSSDYEALIPIQQLAIQRRIAIVLVHHTRKAEASDPFDKVSGTTAITGASDCMWLLTRARGEADAKLYITGRDVEEHELAMRFDKAGCRWSVIGDAKEIAASSEERELLALLDGHTEPIGVRDVQAELGLSDSAAKMRLARLYNAGKIDKAGRGKYVALDHPLAKGHRVTQSHNKAVTAETGNLINFPTQGHIATPDVDPPSDLEPEPAVNMCDPVTISPKPLPEETMQSHAPSVTDCDPVTLENSQRFRQLSVLNPIGDH